MRSDRVAEFLQLEQQLGAQPQAVVGGHPLSDGSGSPGSAAGDEPEQGIRNDKEVYACGNADYPLNDHPAINLQTYVWRSIRWVARG